MRQHEAARALKRRTVRTASLALLGVVLIAATAGCGGEALAALAEKAAGEATAATDAANSARSSLEGGQVGSAMSYADTAATDSQQALNDASSGSVPTQTQQEVGMARIDALAAETAVNVRAVSVTDSAYTKAVRATVLQAICTVVNNAMSGQQQPNVQQWTQQIDGAVQSNLQAAAGGFVPPAVVQQAINAVDQNVNPWVQKYNDVVNFDPGHLQSLLQAYHDFLCG